MPHIVIHEKIHHGNYINRRSALLPSPLTVDSFKEFQDASPYGPISNPARLENVVTELLEHSVAQHGWATYHVSALDDAELTVKELSLAY